MPDPFRMTVRNAEIEAKLKEIGGWIREDMPPGWGFALLIFNFGEGGSMFYTSNATRDSMIESMKEFIAKFREH